MKIPLDSSVNMKNYFEDFIRERIKKPQDVEIQEILEIFQEKKYKKGQIFKEQYTVIKELGFIIKGSARLVIINRKGDEITAQVLNINSFLSDPIGLRRKEKTPIIIEFLENSSLLVAPLAQVLELFERNLTLNILIREYIADRVSEMAKRQIMFLTGSAKERYQFLIESNPLLLKKFPLRFIASMIGITPTQLSRIRNKNINSP